VGDHQRVRLLAKDGAALTIEVEERDPDVDRLACLIVELRRTGGKAPELLRFAALLLRDCNHGDNGLAQSMVVGEPEIEQLVERVTLRSLEAIGMSRSDTPLYLAILVVNLREVSLVRGFEVGCTWQARADG
jgi:hypothetical protein